VMVLKGWRRIKKIGLRKKEKLWYGVLVRTS
jgi:hypothetical protein